MAQFFYNFVTYIKANLHKLSFYNNKWVVNCSISGALSLLWQTDGYEVFRVPIIATYEIFKMNTSISKFCLQAAMAGTIPPQTSLYTILLIIINFRRNCQIYSLCECLMCCSVYYFLDEMDQLKVILHVETCCYLKEVIFPQSLESQENSFGTTGAASLQESSYSKRCMYNKDNRFLSIQCHFLLQVPCSISNADYFY